MASSKETYCLCGQPYNIGQFMIECDCCREWFHGSCVDVKIYQSDDIDKYHCPKCVPTYGASVFKIPTNAHRQDRYEIGSENRPSQAGTPVWVRSLLEAPLRPCAAALQRMRPHQFTEEFVRDNGFTKPVIFHTADGLDMRMPNPATFTVRSVLRYCGAQLEVEVIDVRKQSTVRMPLSEFVDYFESPPEHRTDKVLNVLSLEFSDTNLAPLVEPPAVLRSLDWSARVWPAAEPRPPRPAVQKYCLMSSAGSYTDFHVDFGGTTVWYHVMHGRKIFYLIPPTSTNLALYQQWSASAAQSEQFFGDLVEWYGTAELCAGQTLYIPGGWIHAVLTPRDTLVFGGNLLHSYAVEMQLQIYEIERRVETPLMLRYPLFEHMNWYAGAHLLTTLRRHNEEIQDEEFTLSEASLPHEQVQLAPLLLRGVKILATALKEWHALKSTDPVKRDNVPKCLNSGQLVRELCKELRTLEKRAASTAHKDKDFKVKNVTSPTKHAKKQSTPAKKSLKLTLPKPIMHMGQNGEFPDEKIYTDKFYIDDKEVNPDAYMQDIKYTDEKYIADDKYIADGKYVADGKYLVDINGKYLMDANGKYLEDNSGKYVVNNTKYVVNNGKYVVEKDVGKDFVYQTYDEVPYQADFDERDKKPTVLKIKLNNSPSSSRAPPPYPLPPGEHSILKSHLVRARTQHQQWTISKKEGDFQQVLYTNEHLQEVRSDDPAYGPGMYSAEDIQQDYQYSETAKPGSYQPEYGYHPPHMPYAYTRYEELPPTLHQGASYTNAAGTEGAINGAYHHDPLPTYDAAIAQQYSTPATNTTGYVIEEPAPPPTSSGTSAAPPPAPVRRSERPVRRRVSNTYDYEDSDLYIDDTPAPSRRKNNRHRHHYKQTSAASSNSTGALSSAYRAAPPANGIESLIQASVLADEQPVNDTEDAAVAGMLSIGEQRYTPPVLPTTHLPTPSSSSVSSGSKRVRVRAPVAVTAPAPAPDDDNVEDEEDVIKEVHRDEEYVYPSLEMSSDEDEEWTTTRRRRNSRTRVDKGRGDKDESWSPRARLGRLVPRLRGPARAGVRRECVRAALHAASCARHNHHQPPPHHQNAKRAVLATKSKRPPPPVQNTPKNQNNSRLKKGMKTAKQRLGKILKIHKMIY